MTDDVDELRRSQNAKTPQHARDVATTKIPRSRLIDYTQKRNPNFGADASLEKLRVSLANLDHDDDHQSARSEQNSRPRAPSRGLSMPSEQLSMLRAPTRGLSMPSFRKIDSGEFSFQGRPEQSGEKVNFLFKLQAPKRRRSGPRIDELLEERKKRRRLKKSLFDSFSEDRGRLGRQSHKSAPGNLHLYQKISLSRNGT